jgi:hypothetical protein
MSERVKKYRQKIADQGFQVVEVILSKEIVHSLQILADSHGVHRSKYISTFFTNMCSTDEYKYYVFSRTQLKNSVIDDIRDKHKPEFTDYTLL